ncbi:ATP-dependent translocase ABCB1 [Ixodes scapularis]|uniref:ATP-dependent translocase ABCB1 n=1 Tax=Ixodes scapularis TaxID=6945 RepID=UPI001A9EE803|nr:ATP-dependent translocase ABCB1 [Ixodes scapularis]
MGLEEEERLLLLNASTAGSTSVPTNYGTGGAMGFPTDTIGSKATRKSAEKLPQYKKVPYWKLFRYATAQDVFLVVLGVLFAVIHGAGWPLLAIVFGHMTNAFIHQKQAGFSEWTANGTAPAAALDDAASRQGPGSIFDPVSVLDYNVDMNRFALTYVIIAATVFIASFVHVWCFSRACDRQLYRLRQELFYALLRQDAAWFDRHRSGEVANRMTEDMDRLREGMGDKVGLFVHYVSTFATGFATGFVESWELTLVIMSVTPLLAFASAFLGNMVSQSAAQEQEKYAQAGGVALEVLSKVRTVAAFCAQYGELRRYMAALNDGRTASRRKYTAMAFGFALTFVVLYGAYALAFWYSSVLVAAAKLDAGRAFIVFFAVMVGSFSLGNALPQLGSIAVAKAAARRTFDIIDRRPDIDSYTELGVQLNQFKADLAFKDVSFSYPRTPGHLVLRNVNLEALEGQVVAVCGASGSGKSALLNLVVRFYDPCNGEVTLDGVNLRALNVRWLRSTVSLVSQRPTLFGYSIAENIQFGQEGTTLAEVVEAAKLVGIHDFVVTLPKGYDTEVGERGCQLSEGQRQRLALARALIKNPRVLLLDEATSGLDSAAEAHLLHSLRKGCARRTTIVGTNQLSILREADVVYVLDRGHVVEQGTHQALVAEKGFYYQLVLGQLSESEVQGKEPAVALPQCPRKEETEEQECQRQRMKSVLLEGISPLDRECSRLADDFVNENVELPSARKILRTARPDWGWFFLVSLASIVVGASLPVFAVFYSEIFNTFTLVGSEMQDAAFFWSMMFLALAAVSGLGHFFRTLGVGIAGENLTYRLRVSVLANILRQHLGWFDSDAHSSAKLAARLATDVPVIKTAAGYRLAVMFTSLITLSTSLVLAFVFGWKLALALVAIVPILALAGGLQMRVERGSQRRDAHLMSHALQVTTESLENIRAVQELNLEPTFFGLFVSHLLLPFLEAKKRNVLFALSFAFSQGIMFLVYGCAFRLGAFLVSRGEMDATNVYRVFFTMAFSAVSVGQWTSMLPDYLRARLSAGLVFSLLEAETEIDGYSDGGVRPEVKGRVVLKAVQFSYPSRPELPVLQGLDLELNPGEMLALVGPTGCGKSTLVDLLLRFYDPQSGQVSLDGLDVRAVNVGYLRQHVVASSSQLGLLERSIWDNITYGLDVATSPVSFQQVEQAAKVAQVHDFVTQLPLGYDTPLGGTAMTHLSEGQKQRIALARALLREPAVLILDEATTALDAEHEQSILEGVKENLRGRSCILVSHRLSAIKTADRIAVMDRGVIVEQGSHAELIDANGTYCSLIERNIVTARLSRRDPSSQRTPQS